MALYKHIYNNREISYLPRQRVEYHVRDELKIRSFYQFLRRRVNIATN